MLSTVLRREFELQIFNFPFSEKGFYLVGGIDEAFRIANDNGRIQFSK